MSSQPFKFKRSVLALTLGDHENSLRAQVDFARCISEHVFIVPESLRAADALANLSWLATGIIPCEIARNLDDLARSSSLSETIILGADDRLTGFAERMSIPFMFCPAFTELSSCRYQESRRLTNSPRRVAIVGPESTGKTTLARGLAEKLETVFVPEYVRLMLDFRQTPCVQDDLPEIIRGQVALESALVPFAGEILFCDTEPRLSKIWAETLYQQFPSALESWLMANNYDHYLLTTPDIPWVADPQRCLPLGGSDFFERCQRVFRSTKCPVSIISGDGTNRLDAALRALGPEWN